MDDKFVSFRGQDGNAAEEFIQAVRRAAFSEGKHRDDEWMANFAATCMAGKALRWYDTLDEDVQDSWKQLRKAILEQYPPVDDVAIVPSASAAPPEVAPVAAAPPPPPPPLTIASSQLSSLRHPGLTISRTTSNRRNASFDGVTGVIEIRTADANATFIGYLSTNLKNNGTAQAVYDGRSSSLTQRVTVKPIADGGQSHLQLVRRGPNSQFKFMGIQWMRPSGLTAPDSDRYTAVVFTMNGDGSGSSTLGISYGGPSEASVWSVAANGNVKANFRGESLELYVRQEGLQINLFPDFEACASANPAFSTDDWEKVKLIFKRE